MTYEFNCNLRKHCVWVGGGGGGGGNSMNCLFFIFFCFFLCYAKFSDVLCVTGDCNRLKAAQIAKMGQIN